MKVGQKEADDIGGGLHHDIHGIISDELPDDGFVPRCVFVPITGLKTKVNDMKVSDKPIFTQAMADAGELPPVGSKLTLFKKAHSKRIDEFLNEELTIIGVTKCLDGKNVITWDHEHLGLCCGVYLTEYFKPIDTRADREKAINEMMNLLNVSKNNDLAKLFCKTIYDAGYRKC